jgi:hypothetical protein
LFENGEGLLPVVTGGGWIADGVVDVAEFNEGRGFQVVVAEFAT